MVSCVTRGNPLTKMAHCPLLCCLRGYTDVREVIVRETARARPPYYNRQPLSGYPVSEWGDTIVVTGQPLSGYPVSEWGDTSSDRSASLWLSCVGVGGH